MASLLNLAVDDNSDSEDDNDFVPEAGDVDSSGKLDVAVCLRFALAYSPL